MNFGYRDNFGKVDEKLRRKNLEFSKTVDEFVKHSEEKTLRTLQFEEGQANPAALYGIEVSEQGLGPMENFRYVQDVQNPGRVIDMRHFLEAADVPFGAGEALGLLIELQQTSQGIKSGWEKEDFNSNFLGAVFRNNYINDDRDVSQQFQEFFSDYEKGELKGVVPTIEYFISDVVDLGKDASRAFKGLLGIMAQQQIEQTERDAQILKKAFDILKSSVDQPVYAEKVEEQFEQAENQIRRQYSDPLILDLDGDGIELTSFNDFTVRFDIDGDGFREATGWIRPDDGFLVYDRNNDGYINDISELFGNQTTSGFVELQKLDSNNDGQITTADTYFGDLKIWRDIDQDGYSDVQELFTLEEYDITKISAVGNSTNINIEGNLINETASFEFADGTRNQVANVLFDIDQQNSFYDPYSTFNSQIIITEEILSLPNLRGYGNLPDLYIAIAKDSDLQALVESFVEHANSENISAARQLIRPILLRWANADSSNLGPINSFTQELKFLEKFVGRTWNNNNPDAVGIATIRNTFAQLETQLETRLLVQVVETYVEYNSTSEQYEFSGNINEAIEQFKQLVINSQGATPGNLSFEALALSEFIQQEAKENNLVFNIFSASEDISLETLTNDIVNANINLDANNLSFNGITDTANGTTIINEAGNIEFTPAADFYGIALFEYTISDSTKTFTGLAQVNVAPVNDAPIANSDTAITEEDTTITILATELLSNDSDVEGDTLGISGIDNSANGAAIINGDGNIEFIPDANFNGIATIDYTVTDGIANNTALIAITVNAVNDAPTVANDIATAIDEDTSITILAADLLSNDSDVEGDSFGITSVNSDSGIAILNAEGNIEFTPAPNFNGTATFDYTVNDGTDSSTASVELVINPVNDILVANSDIFTTDEDTPVTISASELFANDVNDDIEKSLIVSQISNSVNGTAIIDEAGNVQFTPAANFKGIASFDYTVTEGTDIKTASVEVVANSINDAPIANSDTATTKEDTGIVILTAELLGNDINLDPEDSLSLVSVNNAANGTVAINQDGNVEFTPDTNFNGIATFDYVVTDGALNDTASVEVVVDAVNDAPILTNSVPNLTVARNSANSVINLADYFEDVENGDNLAYNLGASVSSFKTNSGSNKFFDVFSIDNNKTLTLDYADGVAGNAAITVKVTDSANESVETTFNVSVVNSVPVAANDNAVTDEDTTITISAAELLNNDRDGDGGDNLSIKRVHNSANGTAIINQDGNIEFTPAADFNGNASFEYTVTDGLDDAIGLVSVKVNPVDDTVVANNAPTLANPILNFTVAKNSADSVIKLADYFEDLEDGDNLRYSFGASSSIQGGTSGKFFDGFSFNSSTKSLILDYASDVLGTSTITVRATDSDNESIETSFTVSVVDLVDETPQKDTLAAVDYAIAINEDTSVTILATELLSNDMGGNFTLDNVNNFVSGTAIVNEYGNIEFTPDANFYGAAGFEYTITNGTQTSTGSVSVDVAAVNDAPILVKPIHNFIVTQNALNSVMQLADYFEDVENGNNLGYSLGVSSSIQSSTSGKFFDGFSLDATKALTLDYTDDVIGSSTITVKVTDSGNKFVETAFNVSVIGVSENGDTLLGGDGNDYLVGKQGNDTLNSGAGSDLLEGGAGKDSFIFNSPNEGGDTIADFSVEDDTILFSATGFGGNLTAGAVGSEMLTVGTAATSNEHRFIYDAGSGDFSYDSDGTGDSEKIKLANLKPGLALTHNNLYIEL